MRIVGSLLFLYGAPYEASVYNAKSYNGTLVRELGLYISSVLILLDFYTMFIYRPAAFSQCVKISK